VNYMSRNTETQGIIRSSGGGCVVIGPSSSTPIEKCTTINVTRIRNVDVIMESDEAKDIRKRAWELLKEAAGYLNRRSTWDKDNFDSAMQELIAVFPYLRQESENEGT
jgi:hypothetical protein